MVLFIRFPKRSTSQWLVAMHFDLEYILKLMVSQQNLQWGRALVWPTVPPPPPSSDIVTTFALLLIVQLPLSCPRGARDELKWPRVSCWVHLPESKPAACAGPGQAKEGCNPVEWY